jgi:hypothetical protein
MTTQHVTRYVVTHIGKNGLRTLADAQQGAFTYATPEEAQARIDAWLETNGEKRLQSLFGLPLEVRACQCWAGHFDPVGIYFN